MLSESALFPEGLANSSGHLGRNYMRHMSNSLQAVMPNPVHMYRGARCAGFISDEHRHDPNRGFSGGYLIELAGQLPDAAARKAGWGVSAAGWMEAYDHMAGVLLIGEDPSEANNRIYLHPTERDEHGLPVPVIEYTEHANTKAMTEHSFRQAREIYSALGATEFRTSKDGGCHNMGVARMSAANPTLTIVALAIRQAEHIANSMSRGEL